MKNGSSDAVIEAALKEKIRRILYLESGKPYEEMDADLVTECADFLMEIEGRKRLTEQEIRSIIDNSFPGLKKAPEKKKRFFKASLIASCFAILLLIANAVAMALGFDTMSVLRQWGKSIVEMVAGEEIYIGGISVVKSDGTETYKSIEDLLAGEDLRLLYPSYLPGDSQIKTIYCFNFPGEDVVVFEISDNSIAYNVHLNREIAENERQDADEIVVIGAYECCICRGAGYEQAVFVYDGNKYTVKATSFDELKKMISSVKEIVE